MGLLQDVTKLVIVTFRQMKILKITAPFRVPNSQKNLTNESGMFDGNSHLQMTSSDL